MRSTVEMEGLQLSQQDAAELEAAGERYEVDDAMVKAAFAEVAGKERQSDEDIMKHDAIWLAGEHAGKPA